MINPFNLDTDADIAAYQRWRQWKLDLAPVRGEDLLVSVRDPMNLLQAEVEALAHRCRISNMAFYAGPSAVVENKALPSIVGSHFGLARLDANWLADEDGISSITPQSGEGRHDYIPYTERPIRWHTDGYYNSPQRRIQGMILHCVRPACSGGENAVMDPEIAYILLRDENPGYIRALSASGAMSIPARADAGGEARAESTGPVFSQDSVSGDLHMRYTARTRSIAWAEDRVTRDAIAFLLRFLDGESAPCPWVYRLRMNSGMGLVCNNVLHDRSGFSDGPEGHSSAKRLLYRARFHDRIAQTLGSYQLAFD